MKQLDVAIISGGIAGLVAAIDLAQAGKSVVLLEKSSQFGGRAISVKKNGATFDLGGHAIIKGGAIDQIFQDLGIKMEGGSPFANVSFLWNNQVSHIFRFVFSQNLSWLGKIEFFKFYNKLTKIDAHSVPAISLRSWLEQEIRDPMTRHIAYAMFRVSSYLHAPDHQFQPGWQEEVVAKQYLPNMVVAYDYMHLGREDRFPGPTVPEIAGLYVAGEWASHGEQLADAAAASGRRAARCVLKDMETGRNGGRETIIV